MKVLKRILVILLTMLSLAFSTGFSCNINWGTQPDYLTPKPHKEFVTKYAEQEHLEKLDFIAKRFFERNWVRDAFPTVIDYKIEIMYSFYDGDPEYFLITAELKAHILKGLFMIKYIITA